MASGRSGPARMSTPRLPGTSDEEAAHIAREKQAAQQAEKEAKQAALADRPAERAARRAERDKDKNEKKDESKVDGTTGFDDVDEPGDRPAAITVVHHAPGEEPPTHHDPDADREADAGDAEHVRRS